MKELSPICALTAAAMMMLVQMIVPASADDAPFDIAGTVEVRRVIDGDSLKSGQLNIRIFGIDAPEGRQSCKQADGRDWMCGKAASMAMAEIVASAPRLRCDLLDTDRYGRLVMRCFAGETDIAAALVARGLAVAYRRYSMDYVDDEVRASSAQRGMWQGKFEMPWDWRKKN